MSAGGISALGRSELARVLAASGSTVTPEQVAKTLNIDRVAASKKLARWASEGWMRRARRGVYIPVPVEAGDPRSWMADPLVLADTVWAPCYFTGWTAAHHWALTEQVFRTTVLKTTGRVRRGAQHLLDHDYLIGHVAEEHMTWGLKPLWRAEHRLLIADPARVVIDVFDNPALIGGIRSAADLLEAYLAELPADALIDYGDRLGNRTVFKRLGYTVEQAQLEASDFVATCAERISSGISRLDPSGPPGGTRSSRWGLRVNVTIAPNEPS